MNKTQRHLNSQAWSGYSSLTWSGHPSLFWLRTVVSDMETSWHFTLSYKPKVKWVWVTAGSTTGGDWMAYNNGQEPHTPPHRTQLNAFSKSTLENHNVPHKSEVRLKDYLSSLVFWHRLFWGGWEVWSPYSWSTPLKPTGKQGNIIYLGTPGLSNIFSYHLNQVTTRRWLVDRQFRKLWLGMSGPLPPPRNTLSK